ncbi:MAG TPA: hypothetical protein ENK35_07425 [Candidatus Tenderia sp.]|nr:hypothetical protein [Candidatus Tenderia sp.]
MLGARIDIAPAVQPPPQPIVEAALLGHCPGTANLSAIGSSSRLLMRQSGFSLEMDLLENLPIPVDLQDVLEQQRERLTQLHHLPIPLHSHAEFHDIFPQATQPCAYQSKLAGDHAWLPLAVKDFFDSGGQRLWLISIPENEGQQGFLPVLNNGLQESWGLRGLATTFLLENLGMVAMPDLERLQIAPNLQGVPAKRLDRPEPAFLPCSANPEDDHNTRRRPKSNGQPLPLNQLLASILAALEAYRPDIQCLFTPSLEYSEAGGQPVIATADLKAIDENKTDRHGQLRRVQFIFPYLKNRHGQLKSASGHLLGLQCQQAANRGIWRSIAGQKIDSNSLPFPELDSWQRVALRERPGISLLFHDGRQLSLDDERLAVPALHPGDYSGQSTGQRSAEIRRFMGQLMRELKQLGQSLIFNIDARDAAPRLALENHFNQLYKLGALRGRKTHEAYSIRRRELADNTVQYDIEIAPAYPIDTIKLVLSRANDSWGVSLND